MNKKKNGWFLKTYVLLTVAAITFFTVYAFRYDVLDFLYKKGYVEFETKECIENRLVSEIKGKSFDYDNFDSLKGLCNKKLIGYDYKISIKELSGSLSDFSTASYGYEETGEYWKYEKDIEIPLSEGNMVITVIPKLTDYYKCFWVFSGLITMFICFLVIYLYHWEQKNKYMGRFIIRLWNSSLFNKFHKLSIELFIVNIGSFIFIILLCIFLFINRYSPIGFLRDLQIFENKMDERVNKIQKEIQNLTLNKENSVIIEEILRKHLSSYSYFELQTKNKDYSVYTSGDMSNFFIQDMDTIRAAIRTDYILKNKDGPVYLFVNNHPYMSFSVIYIVFIIAFSFSYYLIFLQLFMRNKIKAIQIIQKDTSILAGGDWSHSFQYYGSDEIGQLSNELRSMQKSFYNNMQNEKIAMKANQELITTLSHDLRTPLTSLLGYLELIRYREGSVEMKREYLDRSLLKVEQIRSLSDKMFEYFLVFEKEESLNLEVQPLSNLLNYIRENIEFMQQDDMNITYTLEDEHYQIACNIEMLQRAMDNLFSNMHKYADHSATAIVRGICEGNQYQLYMSNQIRIDDEKVESNRIGLKSVEKIIMMHNGTVNFDVKENTFTVVLELPLVIAE